MTEVVHAHSLILFIHLCFPSCHNERDMCLSCAGLTVRDFNLSNPNINPIVGKNTHMHCLLKDPVWYKAADDVYKSVLFQMFSSFIFFPHCLHFCWAEFWANTSCLSQPRPPWTLSVKCYPPSHHSCVTGELCHWQQSQAQFLNRQEERFEFVPLIPVLIGYEQPGKGFFFFFFLWFPEILLNQLQKKSCCLTLSCM